MLSMSLAHSAYRSESVSVSLFILLSNIHVK